MSPQLENTPNDEQRGGRPDTGGAPLATRRADLLAAGAGVAVAVVLGVVTPLGPLGAALAAGPVAGLTNWVYDAELDTGFLAGTTAVVALAVVGLTTDLLGVGTAAAGGSSLAAPFVGLVTGGLAVPFGRARQRFDDGRHGR
jgi:hypothetical protein